MEMTGRKFVAGAAAVAATSALDGYTEKTTEDKPTGKKRVGTDPTERAFYRAFRDFNPLNDLGPIGEW